MRETKDPMMKKLPSASKEVVIWFVLVRLGDFMLNHKIIPWNINGLAYHNSIIYSHRALGKHTGTLSLQWFKILEPMEIHTRLPPCPWFPYQSWRRRIGYLMVKPRNDGSIPLRDYWLEVVTWFQPIMCKGGWEMLGKHQCYIYGTSNVIVSLMTDIDRDRMFSTVYWECWSMYTTERPSLQPGEEQVKTFLKGRCLPFLLFDTFKYPSSGLWEDQQSYFFRDVYVSISK